MNSTNLILKISTFACAFPVLGSAQAKAKTPHKPNIIYILADDLGRAELGCYGQQLIETPNLDALAKSGMTFVNHYSGTAVSAPSRCVLFTGLHTGHAYIRGNEELASRGNVWSHEAMLADSTLEGQAPVPATTVMIPAMMKKAGYTTACIGKWGLGYPGSVSTPNKMGFDFFYGYNCQRQAHTYYPPFLYRNEHREYLPNDVHPVPNTPLDKGADPKNEKSYAKYTQKAYSPDLMYEEIIQFIDRSKDEPFVLFWTTPVPHVPLQAPERWVKYYVNKFGDETPYVGSKGYFPRRYPRAAELLGRQRKRQGAAGPGPKAQSPSAHVRQHGLRPPGPYFAAAAPPPAGGGGGHGHLRLQPAAVQQALPALPGGPQAPCGGLHPAGPPVYGRLPAVSDQARRDQRNGGCRQAPPHGLCQRRGRMRTIQHGLLHPHGGGPHRQHPGGAGPGERPRPAGLHGPPADGGGTFALRPAGRRPANF